MYFRNLFLSLFLVLVIGLALVQAESKEPRGPKVTSKVSNSNSFLTRLYGSFGPFANPTNMRLQVYFDIEHGGEPVGRIVMGLYGKTVPEVRIAKSQINWQLGAFVNIICA